MSWTEERVQLLGRLWLEGKSASYIANVLGSDITRNAVIGKVHRLGLSSHARASSSAVTIKKETYEALEPADIVNIAAESGARRVRGRPRFSLSSSKPSGSDPCTPSQELETKKVSVPKSRAKKLPSDVVVPLSFRVTIVDLHDSMCKWPLGDPSSVDFRYCGSPSRVNSPYCQHHSGVAYSSIPERRREKDKHLVMIR